VADGEALGEEWVELYATAISPPLGGALVSLSDITARKRAELAASERLRDLARVSRAVTLGVLSGSLAHELNQPLTAILSNAQAGLRLLDSSSISLPQLREILLDVVGDDQRAGEIIRRTRRLLDLGESEAAEIEMNALVRGALQTVADEALLRRVRTTLVLASDLPRSRGDPVQLEQVFVNLFLNAFDAMADLPREDRRLAVRTTQRGAELIEVIVEDRGKGVDQDQLGRIFEPFYTTKRSGMGMGLYLSRAIIEAHGGCVHAESARPGLRVCVCLPRAERATRHWPLVQCQRERGRHKVIC